MECPKCKDLEARLKKALEVNELRLDEIQDLKFKIFVTKMGQV
jgi:hypothetical protein